jgi:hypothetical protein
MIAVSRGFAKQLLRKPASCAIKQHRQKTVLFAGWNRSWRYLEGTDCDKAKSIGVQTGWSVGRDSRAETEWYILVSGWSSLCAVHIAAIR